MNNNIFYRNYNSYYNYPYNTRYFPSTNYMPNYNKDNCTMNNKKVEEINSYDYKKNNIKTENKDKKTKEDRNSYNGNGKDSREEENNNRGFKFGPINICNNQISLFGHSFAIDDLIIVALIVFLLLESDCDYILLIILGLMLFDISFSSLNFFS